MTSGHNRLEAARRIAERVCEELTRMCLRIEIAGSIRRQRPFVKDVDLVILPRPDALPAILDRATARSRPIKAGPQYVVVEMLNGLQLDLWFAHDGQPETLDIFGQVERAAKPTNFGMLLLSRTGSAMHNVYLCRVAKEQGLHFNPHVGLLSAGRVVASATEEEIFAALKLDFIAPERRER